MRRNFLSFILFLVFLSAVCCPPFLFAKNIVIKVRAANPLETKAKTEMKAYLPQGATPKDVEQDDGFKFFYDKEEKAYYGTKKIKMKPKEVAVGKIVLSDIWKIDPEAWKASNEKLIALEARIQKLPDPSTAQALQDEIRRNLSETIRREAAMTIDRVGAEKHIQEFSKTSKIMKQVEEDLEVLETLVRRAEKAAKNHNKKPKKN
jgi:hypothetical protein